MRYTLGVDLGTTYTAAAVSDQSGARIISLAHDRYAIPSVVAPPVDGSPPLIGNEAVTVAATQPELVAREFKRRFGDTTPIIVGGKAWEPEHLSGLLLEEVLGRTTDLMGSDPGELVVTHPATWHEHRLSLLRSMVADVGHPNARVIPEPVAAAIHYHDRRRQRDEDIPEGAKIAVYDLGGGTFDAAILELSGEGYQISGQPEGLEWLGGIDFDEALYGIIRRSAAEALGDLDLDDANDRLALARLREECTLAKEVLSQVHSATVPVALPTTADNVVVQRDEFEAEIADLVEQTVDALERSLESAGLRSGADLDSVLLVGGSSRIPLVSERLTERLGVPVLVDTHPKQAVALGAVLSMRPLADKRVVDDDETATSRHEPPEPTVLPPITISVAGLQQAVDERYLLVLNGTMAGTTLDVSDRTTTIGRVATGSTVGLNDPLVSRKHFEISRSGDVVSIEDLSSMNGTWVDGARIEGITQIEPGTVIELGTTLLLLEAPLMSTPAPEMLAGSWSPPQVSRENGIRGRLRHRNDGVEWLSKFRKAMPSLASLSENVRRSRRLIRPCGPRTLAWAKQAPERIFARAPDDPLYGTVTLGYGPLPTMIDLAPPRKLRASEREEFERLVSSIEVDQWVPLPLTVFGSNSLIVLPAAAGKSLLKSLLYELVHYHPGVAMVVYGIDPELVEWSFLSAGSVKQGEPGRDFDGLVISFEPGRVASLGSAAAGREVGSLGTLRVTTPDHTEPAAASTITTTEDDGVYRLYESNREWPFIPATLPAGRVPITSPAS